jgi:hypothetical protein
MESASVPARGFFSEIIEESAKFVFIANLQYIA